jgi:uncharacterized protein (DUF2252 family)
MLTVEERRAEGRAGRKRAPRRGQGVWTAPGDRPDPVELLENEAVSRIPELVPIRHGRMSASAFAFFRGAAAVMARDLAAAPHSGLIVQSCGDAHLANFGVYAAPDRRLVFDLNDFDETHPAPFEWDVKRLAASLVIASRHNRHDETDARGAARTAARAYREVMREAAAMRHLDVWYARLEPDRLLPALDRKQQRRMERFLAKAEGRTQLDAFERLAEPVDGTARITDAPPLVVHAPEAEREHVDALVAGGLAAYLGTLPADRRALVARYRVADVARKVVGVGSVGTQTLILLMLGDRPDDPLFLQLKEAQRSVLAEHVPGPAYSCEGERVVEGQRLLQAASDPFLGWVPRGEGRERDFYVRQLRDKKASAPIETMRPRGVEAYGRACAVALARAHARAGDAVTLAAYLGSGDRFDAAIESFAADYADQNEGDHVAFLEACETGRLSAAAG